MSIAINSTIPLVAAQGVTADVVLQPGTVVNAQVLQLLGNDQVRIAIGGQSLDVTSQVPLQAGQTLQLSVSQTADGNINLAVVNQPAGAAASQAAANPAAANATSDAVTLTSAVAATATPANAAAPQPQLTALQALAVSVAAQIAATEQTSMAPLFANLGVAAASGSLPTIVQQAAVQVLAQQTILDQGLTGTDIKQAFQSSGLFLEASLAQGSVSQGVPDLKAALIVLRQVLTTAIDSTTAAATLVPADGQATATTTATATPATLLLEQGADAVLQALSDGSPNPSSSVIITAEPDTQTTASPSLAPSLASGSAPSGAVSQGDAPEIPQGVLEFSAAASIITPATTPADAAARSAASSAALNLLQEAIQAGPLAGPLTAAGASSFGLADSQLLSLLPAVAGARLPNTDEAGFARTNVPPPPISGALPAAQPVIASDPGVEFIGRDGDASSARRYRRCDRAADVAAGGLIAGPGRPIHWPDRSNRAALEFRNPVFDAAGNGDGAIRDFARWRGQQRRSIGQSGVAGALHARRRTGGPGACIGIAERRQDVGADVGGAARDRGSTARRGIAAQSGAEPRRIAARRHRDP